MLEFHAFHFHSLLSQQVGDLSITSSSYITVFIWYLHDYPEEIDWLLATEFNLRQKWKQTVGKNQLTDEKHGAGVSKGLNMVIKNSILLGYF